MTDLQTYYRNIYPRRTIFVWLHKGRAAEAVRREFVFVSAHGNFARNLRFSSAPEFHSAMLARNPARIEVGPQFNTLCRPGDEWIGVGKTHNTRDMDRVSQQVRPAAWQDKIDAMQKARRVATRASSSSAASQVCCVGSSHRAIDPNIKHFPIRRELVFDIDLTDYDDVRVCCQGKVVCNKCWILVYAAVLVIQDVLREKLNFQHIIWVYSGRRGVHCWVSDEAAMVLSDAQRENIVNNHFKRPVHLAHCDENQHFYEHLARAFLLLLPVYEHKWLPAQCGLKYDDFALHLDARIRSHFPSTREGQTALERYTEFVHQTQLFEQSTELMSRPGAYSLRDCKLRIVLATLFPRIDRQVTVKMGHLLKLPFCVHPDTLQLCLPFPAHTFDSVMAARTSPTLQQILSSYPQWAPPQIAFSASLSLLTHHANAIRTGLSRSEIETVRPAAAPPKSPSSPMQRLSRAFARDGFSLRD